MHDTRIADRLRAAGLNVVEVAGWQTRGSASFDILGSLDHHTAGSASGNAPSLNVCIYGRSDLPGPLCQVLMGRDNTCYVIAAGRANHAGTGNWRGLTSNGQLSGLERENVGTTAEPWREDQTDAAARAHAALIRGLTDADMVARHAEYALPVGRKPDTHSVSGPDLRRRVGDYLTKQGGGPLPKDWFDMATQADLEAVVRKQGPWLGEVYGDPDRAWFIFDGGVRTWVSSMGMIAVQRDFFNNLYTDNGKPWTPKPDEARGFYLVNRVELEAHLGHPYEF